MQMWRHPVMHADLVRMTWPDNITFGKEPLKHASDRNRWASTAVFPHGLRIEARLKYAGFALLVSVCESVYYAHGACTQTTFPMLLSVFPETQHRVEKKEGRTPSQQKLSSLALRWRQSLLMWGEKTERKYVSKHVYTLYWHSLWWTWACHVSPPNLYV